MGYTLLWHTAFLQCASIEFIALSTLHFGRVFAYTSAASPRLRIQALPTMATTRAPCSTTSGTRRFSTPSDTPKWRPTDLRTFGGTDDGGAGSIGPHGRSSRSKRTTRHIVEITRPAAVGPCAPCAPAGRCPQTATCHGQTL